MVHPPRSGLRGNAWIDVVGRFYVPGKRMLGKQAKIMTYEISELILCLQTGQEVTSTRASADDVHVSLAHFIRSNLRITDGLGTH